jgi:hypothetical protein
VDRQAEVRRPGVYQIRRPRLRALFEALMKAVRHCSLGQISEAFFEVGGQYRRNV